MACLRLGGCSCGDVEPPIIIDPPDDDYDDWKNPTPGYDTFIAILQFQRFVPMPSVLAIYNFSLGSNLTYGFNEIGRSFENFASLIPTVTSPFPRSGNAELRVNSGYALASFSIARPWPAGYIAPVLATPTEHRIYAPNFVVEPNWQAQMTPAVAVIEGGISQLVPTRAFDYVIGLRVRLRQVIPE